MDNKLVKWVNLLTEIWESRDHERVGELVAEKFEYFEWVHKPAITSVEESMEYCPENSKKYFR